LKNLRVEGWGSLSSGILLVLASLGCGSGGPITNPAATVTNTSHPLVAQYNISMSYPQSTAWVEFGTDTTYGRLTSSTPPTSQWGQAATILVAGMKPNSIYHMRAHAEWNGGSWVDQDQTFTTGALPGAKGGLAAPGIAVTRPNPSLTPAPGVELFSLVGPNNMLRAFVTDLQGNVIWYFDPGPTSGSPTPIKPMQNGHFIINTGELREVDLIGNTIREVTGTQLNPSLQARYSFTITAFHHDVIVLPNGHWIVLAYTSKGFTDLPGYPGVTNVIGDALIDIDLNGNVAWAWSAFNSGLDINRHLQGLPDWTHSNAIIYAPDGNLLLSMRHQSWILKIDYENGAGSGNILWRLGEDGDFALAGGDPSDWFYAQHDPNLISTDGSQMMFDIWDNGNLRVAADGSVCTATCYSRAAVFQVDEDTRTASLLWQDLPGFYSFWGGSIEKLPNGNIEFDMTAPFTKPASQIMEVTRTDNPQTVWQLNLTGENAYRGYRIPSLYPGVSWQK
jgi:arylsulfate sulfotransferase